MEQHFQVTDAQINAIRELKSRFQNYNNNIYTYLGNVRSYTLRNNFEEAFPSYESDFTYSVIKILGYLDPIMYEFLSDLFRIKDRGGSDRDDPINSETSLGMAYIPKGLTDFNPANKTLADKTTAFIRRELLKANAADPACPETDKSVTVRIYETETSLHVYFNKYSAQTLRRLTLLVLKYAYQKFIAERDRFEFDKEDHLIDLIIQNLCSPTETSAELIITCFKKILDKILNQRNKNLVIDFANAVQKTLNTRRKQVLDSTKQNAESYYQAALSNLSRYAVELRNANQALSDYNEVSFSAIRVLLEKIQKHPNTKLFEKYDQYTLQFIIEEPLLFTEDKIWSKYIANVNSEIREKISVFAERNADKYNTTPDILNFCIQRLFKEVLIDQKIKLYTASFMYLNQNDTQFNIRKKYLPSSCDFFPHPHLGTNGLTCWGDSMSNIILAINRDDGETAFLQLIYAFQQMTAADTIVARVLTNSLLDIDYHKRPVFQKGKNSERTTFEEIIKEFVEYETNKINAPDDTSSETSI